MQEADDDRASHRQAGNNRHEQQRHVALAGGSVFFFLDALADVGGEIQELAQRFVEQGVGGGGGLIIDDGRPKLLLCFAEGGAQLVLVFDVREGDFVGGQLDLVHGLVAVGLLEGKKRLGGADVGADFEDLAEVLIAGEGRAQVALEAQKAPDGSAGQQADGANHCADLKGHFPTERHILTL